MSATLDIFHPDFVLAASDVLAYGEEARDEESEMNYETRAMLESICASVEGACEGIPVELADSLADLDELLDRHGL